MTRLCSWALTRILSLVRAERSLAVLRRGDDITDLREAVER